ncbi:conserved protein, unknown function [Hepatocystis sp. ex Piliocolobus tephrosceles]|nr:conserved protein, unknown function [Hepatocystis sp. ex Piliocolobus tephrosceles]
MDYFDEDLLFENSSSDEKTKKNKKKYENFYKSYKKKRKNTDVKDDDYLKPVKFISAGFLNRNKTKNDKKDVEENNDDVHYYSTSDDSGDSEDYEKYDVFKHFVFDLNFDVENQECNFIKDNLKKYNLNELKESDKHFEQYGLGFKILKKMGYEDGIGKKIKTNIAPIEVKKKHARFMEEKKNKYSDDYNFEDDNYKDYNFEDDNYNDIFDTLKDINNVWKKNGTNCKKYWNFNKIKNQVKDWLNYQASYLPNEISDYNYDQMDDTYIRNIQNVQHNMNQYIKKLSIEYFDAKKKKKLLQNKLKNYKKSTNENDMYKTHLLILKNILTYKYLLNLHTILAYPPLLSNKTYNEYLFEYNHNYKKQMQIEEHNNDDKHMEQDVTQPNSTVNTTDDDKLININNPHLSNVYNKNNETYYAQVANNLFETYDVNDNDTFEKKLNDILIKNYKTLCEQNYFKNVQKESKKHTLKHNNTYKLLENLENIYHLINIKNIQVKKKNDPLFLSDLYIFMFFIYENSKFLCLNKHVSFFFLEFLRVYFYNKQNQNIQESSRNDILLSEKQHDEIITDNPQNVLRQQIELAEEEHIQTDLIHSADAQTNQNAMNHIKHNTYKNIKNLNNNETINENNIKYLIHFKKLVLMGINEHNTTECHNVEIQFDNIIYFNLIYNQIEQQNYYDFFNYITLFKDVFSNNYYKKILIFFIKKKIITNITDSEKNQLNENILLDIKLKLSLLFHINKQFDISSYINQYYTQTLSNYLRYYDISANYIKLIKLTIKNNMYKKEIFEIIVKRIINELLDIDFANINFSHLNKIMLLHNCIDDNIICLIFKIYFFYNYSKQICTYLRELTSLYGDKTETNNNIDTNKVHTIDEKCTKQQNIITNENQKKELLTAKKKEIYETFKKVKNVFENNLMQNNSIKNIMFTILNVIKTYVMKDQILNFSVEQVLDYDKTQIFSDDNINYYFLYKNIKIPIPFYATMQRNNNNNIYNIYQKHNILKNSIEEESNSNYHFSIKKYINIRNNLEKDIIQHNKKKQEEEKNINVKTFIEQYCFENGIVFLQKKDRKINGNPVFAINNSSIYINNNIIYMYEDEKWKPTLLSDLIQIISK